MPAADPIDATGARWPGPPGRGHYESYYVEAARPGGGQGLWLRCTVLRRPGGAAQGAVWAAFVDAAEPGPFAVRQEGLPVAAGDGAWIRCADSGFSAAGTLGSVRTGAGEAWWDLAFRSGEPALFHLPSPWMYRARLPRTKLVTVLPGVTVDGSLSVDGRMVEVTGWRGAVGHNWGDQHADRWVWLNGVVRSGSHAGSWLDLAVARVRVAGAVLPWTAFGAVRLDGRRYALGGFGRRPTVHAAADGLTLTVAGADVRVQAWVSAAAHTLVRWDYDDPDGPSHAVTNSPTADLRVRVERRGRSAVELRLDGCATYEHGAAGR